MRSWNHTRKGFTLVELLAVLVILVTLAAIVVPRFIDAGVRSRETALKSSLAELRNAITIFRNDTGYYPATLADLAVPTAPAQGYDRSGTLKPIDPADWHGPYLDKVPVDPVSKQPFIYYTSPVSKLGQVQSSATGTASDGTDYSTW